MADYNSVDRVEKKFEKSIFNMMPYPEMFVDDAGIVRSVNYAFKKVFGCEDEVVGQKFDVRRFRCNYAGDLGETKNLLELPNQGGIVVMEQVKLCDENTDFGTLYTFQNKSVVDEEEQQISDLADRDYLTKLYNRRGLYTYYEELEEDSNHFLFLDLDNFKIVNDVYGHSAGDDLLIKVGEEIQKCLPDKCTVARIGGDEFVVVLSGIYNEDEVVETAKKMLVSINTADYREDILSVISVSIGIILNQSKNQALDDILYKCDAAMYRAKENGKNQYIIFNTMEDEVRERRTIEEEMHQALENGEFIVYLQPKFNMLTSQMYGAEALVRWNHPKDGIREPGKFIPVLEKTGFITAIDLYVFEEVCKLKQSWKGKEYEHIAVSVNMSRLHFYREDFIDQLVSIAEKYEIKTSELELEITESIFFRDMKKIIAKVNELKKAGFFISVDDFGSAYSSLNMLKDIPANILKLDRKFLQVSSDDLKGKTVIRNIITMGKDLKLELVAEGVETLEQVLFLTSCGCELAQGFYYSKPMPVEDFDDFARSHMLLKERNIRFSFDGTFWDDEHALCAEYYGGNGVKFVDGVLKGHKAVYFPGGSVGRNMLRLPNEVLWSESYTIKMWIKVEKLITWGSLLYIEFDNGFASLAPLAWDGSAVYRIKDAKRVDGWYDTPICSLIEGEWVSVTVTYDARSEIARLYFNGQMAGALECVPTMRVVKNAYLGGDIYKRSFEGAVCELEFTDKVKSAQTIWNEYLSFTEQEDFLPILHGEEGNNFPDPEEA